MRSTEPFTCASGTPAVKDASERVSFTAKSISSGEEMAAVVGGGVLIEPLLG